MNDILQTLRQHDALIWAWRAIVWAAAAYLIILGALIFVRPTVVHHFFGGFARSWGINFSEAVLRLIVGLGFIGMSPETKLPLEFFYFGVVLAATAVPMMFLYKAHKSQRGWVIPLTKRILPLMGVCALAFGALIGWAAY